MIDVAVLSALSILADLRELGRVRTCLWTDFGWLFLDETRKGGAGGAKWKPAETGPSRSGIVRGMHGCYGADRRRVLNAAGLVPLNRGPNRHMRMAATMIQTTNRRVALAC